jgi:ribosome biogenesis protein ERB1
VAWYDTELSTKPYRALRYHQGAVRAVAFHRSYPLFASASDDGSVHVFHGMVYQVRVMCLMCKASVVLRRD